jgi:predicted HTH domain antitoxin
MTLQLGDDLRQFLPAGEKPAEDAARELIVLELYRQHKISGGKAAELLHTGRIDFMQRTSDLGIPSFDMGPEDWKRELDEVEALSREHGF